MESRDDNELVALARAGDRDATDALLRRHVDRIHGVCVRIAGRADAADATQEALIAIVKGLHRFDGRSSFSTWAYRVATNACLDELRRRRRRPMPAELTDADVVRAASLPLAEDVALRADIDGALERLPLDYRAAVVLRDLCGLDYAEIATTLGVPIGTVRSRIARGRAALVPLLSGNWEPGHDRPSQGS